MVFLKFYQKELKEFATYYQIKLTFKESKKLARKIFRHYLGFYPNIYSHNGRLGHASQMWSYIKLPKRNCPLGLVIHECSHIIDINKRRKSKHDKKLMSIIRKVTKYVDKTYISKNCIPTQKQKV